MALRSQHPALYAGERSFNNIDSALLRGATQLRDLMTDEVIPVGAITVAPLSGRLLIAE